MAKAWDVEEKSQHDMSFLLIVPSLGIRCKRVFGLTAVWAHTCQAHFLTLGEAAHKLVLLARGKHRLALHLHAAK